jgi:competence protein ComEC
MADRHVVVLALAACAGAWFAAGPSRWLGFALVVLALLARRPVLLCAAVAVLASGLGAAATDGLVAPAQGSFAGTLTLLSDPAPAGSGLRADARMGSKHVELVARDSAAKAIADRLAGEQIDVRGKVQRLSPAASWLTRRHIVGRVTIDEVDGWRPGGMLSRFANSVHRALAGGAEALPAAQRPLFLGIVLGDDRNQPPEVTDDFRGAGLSHLLAVSGQNVAFVLALAGPLLRRLRLGGRLVVTLSVIGGFALITRFEPSVLRASAMAAVAAVALAWGREATSRRALALAVALLVLVDPFLVSSVGFQLSVAASAGILWLGPRLSAVIPGPRPLADAMAVTLAAQAAVAPLLVSTFGGLPLASVPANLLAVPAAGPVMMWGLGAGIPAGVLGGRWATILHFPTRVLVGWVAGVAHWGAGLPLGELGARELVALAVGIGLLLVARRWRVHWLFGPAVAIVVVAVVAPALAMRSDPSPMTSPAAGLTLWRAGPSAALALDGRADAPAGTLEALRRAGLRRLDVLVVLSTGAPARDVAAAIIGRYEPRLVVARPSVLPTDLGNLVVARQPLELRVGSLTLAITPREGRLTVEEVAAGARGPPV